MLNQAVTAAQLRDALARADRQEAETRRLQDVVAIVGSVVLVPQLITGFFGVNAITWPARGLGGALLLVLLMAVSAMASLALVHRYGRRR